MDSDLILKNDTLYTTTNKLNNVIDNVADFNKLKFSEIEPNIQQNEFKKITINEKFYIYELKKIYSFPITTFNYFIIPFFFEKRINFSAQNVSINPNVYINFVSSEKYSNILLNEKKEQIINNEVFEIIIFNSTLYDLNISFSFNSIPQPPNIYFRPNYDSSGNIVESQKIGFFEFKTNYINNSIYIFAERFTFKI